MVSSAINLPLVIVGGGGHARVLAEAAQAAGYVIKGYLAPEPSPGTLMDYLGPDDSLEEFAAPASINLVIGVGSTGRSSARRSLFEVFRSRGYGFATVVHPSAIVSPSARLDVGCQIFAGAVIQAGSVIGENTIVNTSASIDHDCTVGAHVHIAPGAILCGGVIVGDGAHVGAGAIAVQNVRIPEESLVKAGVRVR